MWIKVLSKYYSFLHSFNLELIFIFLRNVLFSILSILIIFFNLGKFMLFVDVNSKENHLWHNDSFELTSSGPVTPARTLSISGRKSRVLKLSFLSLKMMAKSGLEYILKFTEPLQRYLLSCQANSAILGRYFCTGQQQLWKGLVNFKIKSLDHFLPSFLSKKW